MADMFRNSTEAFEELLPLYRLGNEISLQNNATRQPSNASHINANFP
jgi:hypothetical protein